MGSNPEGQPIAEPLFQLSWPMNRLHELVRNPADRFVAAPTIERLCSLIPISDDIIPYRERKSCRALWPESQLRRRQLGLPCQKNRWSFACSTWPRFDMRHTSLALAKRRLLSIECAVELATKGGLLELRYGPVDLPHHDAAIARSMPPIHQLILVRPELPPSASPTKVIATSALADKRTWSPSTSATRAVGI